MTKHKKVKGKKPTNRKRMMKSKTTKMKDKSRQSSNKRRITRYSNRLTLMKSVSKIKLISNKTAIHPT